MFAEKTVAETREILQSEDASGLSEAEVKRRLARYGPNELARESQKSFPARILSQFMDPLIYVLMAAGVVSVCLGEAGDACIIAAVVLLNGAVGLIQEGKAKRALDSLKKMTRLKAVVKRGGTIREVDAAELVPGDLVLIDAGRQVPADLRLLESEDLKVEESALTGESSPVEKDFRFVAKGKLPAGDRKNMAYMSSNVTSGRGEGIVCATGMDTEIGQIAKLIHEAPEEATPLQKRLGELGGYLSVLAVALCAALFAVAVWQRRDVGEMLITAISLAVAAVPEGLPAVVTIVLALSVSRMVKVNTIVRRLPSVETLGAVNVVCSDKTGTLTQNKMTVDRVIPAGRFLGRRGQEEELVRAFCLCCDARETLDGGIGDPTELALLEYGEKNWPVAEWKERYPRIAERAFDSDRKMMTTVHAGPEGRVSFTKGAPDVILERCSRYRTGNGTEKLGREQKLRILEQVEALSGKAFRVLGAAYKEGGETDEQNLIFLGAAAMEDPPRPEVFHAVEMFAKAHVRTVMITGDHSRTAFAIAKKLGIAETESQCMSGAEIEQAGEAELKKRLRTVSVFSRVSPDHKVRIIRALKADGNIVAMTGDGVNDAPSLKAADVGIAMGLGGTDVARQAADLVLTDDNFATIEKAMEEGRGIYENIRKAVIFLLSSNFGEIMTMFTAIVLAFPAPLKASHILWINLITDSLPALALGTDVNDGAALMEEPPRQQSESLFSRGGLACTVFYGLLIAAISLAAFFLIPVRSLLASELAITYENLAKLLGNKEILMHCQTYAFTVLGLSQLFHAVGMRDVSRSVFRMNHRENPLMLIALGAGVLLQVMVTEIPSLVALFQTAALTGEEWRELLGLAAFPMIAHEIFSFSGRWGRKNKKEKKQ